MPRKKRTTRNNTNDSVISIKSDVNSSVFSVRESANSTLTSEMNESNISAWYTEMEEKIQAEIDRVNNKAAEAKENLDLHYQMILVQLPKNILNKTISLNDERLYEALNVLNSENVDSDGSDQSMSSPVAVATVKKRRSRSVVKESEFLKPEVPTGLRRTTRIRSSSADAYQTPKNKVRLSALTTAKKYTVSKPPKKAEDSGINLKRFMRPDEEAISTSGSPLYVHPGAASSTPHVNIPLPGGVVMSIEPKRPRGRFEVPELDEQTRKQIKILCEQLKNIAEH